MRLLGWAHPAFLNLLRYNNNNNNIFIDGTFRCVPRNYEQCVVFMVRDRASGMFVPVFHILGTSRTGNAHWDMMHFVVQSTDQKLSPSEVMCDFESALIDAVRTQFRNAIYLGCLFHVKQA
ncbi:hypothetical protein PHMEG_0008754 [Phytophthora megakarya]|uniref:MULE transposase domain-containing protein n=1 Tax=Phytophthora megakarya TaxID=4795 RepID=A0A225WJM2_9STRA|nr:hypothetical protein PHMEG_0008754 [Phytophthora megakarya]